MSANKKFKTSLISIKKLTELAKINYFTLYQRQKGNYKSDLTLEIKTKIVNALITDITPFLADLGFNIKVTRIARKD